jgi:hypothetical protein
MREVEITWGANRALVARLAESGARFFVSGSTAARFHVPERDAPNDLDLVVEPSAEMFGKLNAALAHVGAGTILATSEEFAKPDKGTRIRVVLNLDILTPPAGVDFAKHWAAAEEAVMNLTSTRVRVASIPTLQLLLRFAQQREPARAQVFEKDLGLLDRAARIPSRQP